MSAHHQLCVAKDKAPLVIQAPALSASLSKIIWRKSKALDGCSLGVWARLEGVGSFDWRFLVLGQGLSEGAHLWRSVGWRRGGLLEVMLPKAGKRGS